MVVILVTVYIFPSLYGTSYGAHPVAVKYASIFVLFSEDGLVNMFSSAGPSAANLVTVSRLVLAVSFVAYVVNRVVSSLPSEASLITLASSSCLVLSGVAVVIAV